VRAVDGHRHMFQSEVKGKSNKEEGTGAVPVLERKEAARRILKVLSKLGQAWTREPQILPGWRDSLW